MLETLDEAVASIAEREQAITGTGKVLSSLQGAHGSLESSGRDQTHVAIMWSQRSWHKGVARLAQCKSAPRWEGHWRGGKTSLILQGWRLRA